MAENKPNKRKIINDPVYGFINIPSELTFDIINHKYFQRLRRIKQLGLSEFVYPGATHTRFQHTLGALHLLNSAIQALRLKNIEITKQEEEAVTLAILLHDIGHSPFSHNLERVIVKDFGHEDISLMFMESFNHKYKGKLDMAISIFKGQYHKNFLHQLVSSQLDVDRLDYLRRDSFYTGVSEGVISSDRIIKMLNVANDQLVVEAKGIYSIEKFIMARWLMYWQVYLHKTVISTEQLLFNIFKRLEYIIKSGQKIFLTKGLYFFYHDFNKSDKQSILKHFSSIDDSDIIICIKEWKDHPDRILAELCQRLINRNLFRIEIQKKPFNKKDIVDIREQVSKTFGIKNNEIDYFVSSNYISRNAYSEFDDKIQILHKDGSISDIAKTSDLLNTSILSKVVKKYFLCYPKEIIRN